MKKDLIFSLAKAIGASIVLYGLIAYLFYSIDETNPRELNGVDTIKSGDSTYVIKFKIDTVYETEENNDY